MFQVSRAVRRPIAMFVDQSDSASIQGAGEKLEIFPAEKYAEKYAQPGEDFHEKASRVMKRATGENVAFIATAGLAVPWVTVRMARYRARKLCVVGTAPLTSFAAASGAGASGESQGGSSSTVDASTSRPTEAPSQRSQTEKMRIRIRIENAKMSLYSAPNAPPVSSER